MTTDFKFRFIGWNQEGTSDKIWGYFTVGDDPTVPSWRQSSRTCYVFWGRRGKTPSFKKDVAHEARYLAYKKCDKGYDEIDEKKLREVWPDIDNVLEGRLAYAMLADKV